MKRYLKLIAFLTIMTAGLVLGQALSALATPITWANPTGGTFSSELSVSLNAGEEATIYYTTDGSNPIEASNVG